MRTSPEGILTCAWRPSLAITWHSAPAARLAAIGAAGIPAAGLVMISVILEAVGLPLEGLALILAIDPVLDMCRTAVNVFSDSCGAVVIARSEGEHGILQKLDEGD